MNTTNYSELYGSMEEFKERISILTTDKIKELFHNFKHIGNIVQRRLKYIKYIFNKQTEKLSDLTNFMNNTTNETIITTIPLFYLQCTNRVFKDSFNKLTIDEMKNLYAEINNMCIVIYVRMNYIYNDGSASLEITRLTQNIVVASTNPELSSTTKTRRNRNPKSDSYKTFSKIRRQTIIDELNSKYGMLPDFTVTEQMKNWILSNEWQGAEVNPNKDKYKRYIARETAKLNKRNKNNNVNLSSFIVFAGARMNELINNSNVESRSITNENLSTIQPLIISSSEISRIKLVWQIIDEWYTSGKYKESMSIHTDRTNNFVKISKSQEKYLKLESQVESLRLMFIGAINDLNGKVESLRKIIDGLQSE